MPVVAVLRESLKVAVTRHGAELRAERVIVATDVESLWVCTSRMHWDSDYRGTALKLRNYRVTDWEATRERFLNYLTANALCRS